MNKDIPITWEIPKVLEALCWELGDNDQTNSLLYNTHVKLNKTENVYLENKLPIIHNPEGPCYS